MTATEFFPSGEVVGLTDRPRLPRLGKIRLGVKTTNAGGTTYPKAVDYFVVPEVVQGVYGEKPRELDIVFPIDDVSRVAYTAWKKYAQTRGKVCTSDGQTAVRIVDLEQLRGIKAPTQADYDAAIATGTTTKWERREIPCPTAECVFAKDNSCKAVMNLQFMLPRVPGIGIWQLDTGSVNSIIDVRGGIEIVRKLSGGRLAGIPLKLRVEPTEAFPDGKKKVVFTLKLISPEKLADVLSAGDHTMRELLMADHAGELVQLPAGRDVPEPVEPETDLFAAGEEPSDTSGKSIEATSPAAAAAPDADVAIAAEIEELFSKLEIKAGDRNLFRSGYKGKAAKLRDMLREQLAKKNTS